MQDKNSSDAKKLCGHGSASFSSRRRESGNIFFALFGAVALIGVIGASTVAIMRGPLSTMVEVQNRTQAESEMAIASRLSLLEASELTADGDCDADGFVEPLEWTDAAGNGPTGGGFLPSEVSSARLDPWGTEYGYCAWDAGTAINYAGTGYPDSCDNGGGSSDTNYNRLSGNGSSTDDTYTIVAIISAGANQQFETSCTGGATPDVTKGGDDIVVEYTYESAVTATNGLWNIKPGDPGVAEIDKEIEVGGNIDLNRGGTGTGQLQLGAGSMIYPDQTVLSICPGVSNVNVGLLRMNTGVSPYRLEICDTSGWVSSGGTGVWSLGTGSDIYYNPTTPEVGIGTTTPSHTLEVVGTFDNSGAVTFGSTLGVTGSADFDSTFNADGAATLGSTLGVVGATDLDSTLNVDGAATLGDTLGVAGAADLDSTLNVDGATTLVGTLDAQDAISNSTGNLTLNDDVDITDDLDVNGNADIDGTLESDDYTWNGNDFTPATCASGSFNRWDGDSWECEDDISGTSGGTSGTSGGIWEVVSTVVRVKTSATDYATDSLVFGSPQMDDDGDADHQARLFFDKATASFRAGADDNGSWDTANRGYASIGLGYDAVASGNSSFAAGLLPTASGMYSVAIGRSSQATHDNAIAIGDDSEATNDDALALGSNTTASGLYSTAIGQGSTASAQWAFALGNGAAASGVISHAFGTNVAASGQYSTAIGMNVRASGQSSMAFSGYNDIAGPYAQVSGTNSFGFFMGSNAGYNLSVANRFGIVGGHLMIDDAGATGSQGCVRYNGTTSRLQFSHDCTTYSDLAGASSLVGGADTQVQYNDGGVFGGDAGLTFNETTNTLTVGNAVVITGQAGSAPVFMNLDDLGDVDAASPSDQDCIVFNNSSGNWENVPCSTLSASTSVFEVTGGAGTELVRQVAANAPLATSDFVFGSSQLADVAAQTWDDARMFFDKSKGAFRAGNVDGDQWDDANVGEQSFASGLDSTASGDYSIAMGYGVLASGDMSVALGSQASATAQFSMAFGNSGATASGYGATAIGWGAIGSGTRSIAAGLGAVASGAQGYALGTSVIAAGDYSTALGREINISATGDGSMGVGLTTTSPATDPIISGAQSFGIFMGDQSGYDLAVANRMALVGGHFMIDDAGATGSQGCFRYDGTNSRLQFSHDCTTYADIGSVAAGTIAINDLSDGLTDYANNNLYLGSGTGGSNGVIANYEINTGVGIGALANIGTGCAGQPTWRCQYNVAFGYEALNDATTAASDIAIGYRAMDNATTAYGNTAIGEEALGAIDDDAHNTVVGARSTTALTAGSNNVIMGTDAAMSAFTTGSDNVFLGEGTAYSLTSGNRNIFIGEDAGDSQTSGNDNIVIGEDEQLPNLTGSNQLNIGGTIYGNLTNDYVGIGTPEPQVALHIDRTPGAAHWEAIRLENQSFSSNRHTNISFWDGNDQVVAAIGSVYDNVKGTNRVDFHSMWNGSAMNDDNIIMSVLGSGRVGIGDFDNDDVESTLHLQAGDIRLDGGAANQAGCIRYDDTADELLYSDDCTTFTAFSDIGAGDLWTDNTTHISRGNMHIINATETMTTAGLNAGMGDGFVWHNDKAALRIGTTPNTSWDEANIGQYSFAHGEGSSASGYNSVALVGASASGSSSLAIGGGSASGAGSFAMGGSAEASAVRSKVFGQLGEISNTGTNSVMFNIDGTYRMMSVPDTFAITGGDFVVGSTQLDDTTTGNEDSRMFFDISKGAFRAGNVDADQWDDANIGVNSFASGSSRAMGVSSVALGGGNTASGIESFATGLGAVANNNVSFAAGQFVTASGYNSIAHGQETTASGDYAVAFGLGNATGTGPIVSGTSSFGIFMGDQSGYDIATANRMGIVGGHLMIDDAAAGSQGCIRYVQGTGLQFSHDCTTYSTMTAGGAADVTSGVFEIASNVTRVKDLAGDWSADDFVFGSDRLADVSAQTWDDNRFFFDKSKGAFRAGIATGDHFDDTNIGTGSAALGYRNRVAGNYAFAAGSANTVAGESATALGAGNTASAQYSTALGYSATASGYQSLAWGWTSNASGTTSVVFGGQSTAAAQSSIILGGSNSTTATTGNYSMIMGFDNVASGLNSVLLGRKVTTTAAADHSAALGLGNPSGANPQISGDNSFGIFMGDQSGYTLSANNRMALVGGHFMIDDAGATGSQGCFRYDGTNSRLQYSHDCTTYADIGSVAAGTIAINDLSDAMKNFDGTNDNMTIGHEGTSFTAGSGIRNLMIGHTAGDSITTGDENVGIGRGALTSVTTTSDNVALGNYALYNNVSDENTAIGTGAMRYYSGSGNGNTAVGFTAGPSAAGGLSAVGNVSVGSSALNSTTAGDYNVAVGGSALGSNLAKGQSTAVGYSSMRHMDNTTTEAPSYNSAFGYNSLRGATTTASLNTGTGNTAIGHTAIQNITSGNNNTALGYLAGDTISSGANNIAIGYNADFTDGTLSNQLNIGNTIYGDLANDYVGINKSIPTATLDIVTDSVDSTDDVRIMGSNYPSLIVQSTNANGGNIEMVTDTKRWGFYVQGDTFNIEEDNNDARFTMLAGGNIGLGVSPASKLHLVDGDIRLDGGAGNQAGCIRYDDTADELQYSHDCTTFTAMGAASGGLWTDNTTHISRENFHILDAGLAAGSTTAGLDGIGTYSFYDPDKGAFRGGEIAAGYRNTAWEDANIGENSFAWGRNVLATGEGAIAFGIGSGATGDFSLAIGSEATASNNGSYAIGVATQANGVFSHAFGAEAIASGSNTLALGSKVTASGTESIAIGAGLATGAAPVVSGANSIGVFMGDQSGVDLSATNTMALVGGDFIVGSYMKGDSGGTHDNRMFFDVAKAAFRAGNHDNVYWDDAEVGLGSVAFGGAGASGPYSFAVGENSGGTWASGYQSVAFGGWAEGSYAMTFGGRAEAAGSKTFGGAHVSGDGSIGMATETNYPLPIVSATNAVGIFMGDQSNYDMSVANRMALVGGHFMIDDAGATGSQGCFRYNGATSKLQYSHDCTTFADMGAASGMAINDLSDAMANHTDFNIMIGHEGSTITATSGLANIGIGRTAADSITTGDDNIAIGNNALTANQTLGRQIAIGTNALTANTGGDHNIAIGYDALAANTGGGYNVVIGNNAGGGTGSNFRTAIGHGALASGGEEGTAVGYRALYNTTGSFNTGVGKTVLEANTSGYGNTAMGFEAMLNNIDGSNNNVFGSGALRANVDGGNNAVFGGGALDDNTSGSWNTAIGNGALGANTDGVDNVALGFAAGDNITTGDANIIIGTDVDAPSATGNNQLNIGDTIYGDLSTDQVAIGTATQTTGAQFKVAGTSSIMIPAGSDAQRPTGAAGMVRVNTTASPDAFEYYNAEGTAWVQLGAGGSSLWTDNTTHISRAGVHVLNASETSDSTDMSIAGGGSAGKRMFFDMTKGSIRGGEIEAANDAWDNANITDNSFAWGLNAQASDGGMLAIGSNVTATTGAFAIGGDISATQGSIVLGGAMDAYGLGAIAIGNNATSGGNSSIAIGSYVYATAGNAIAMGISADAQSASATAIGNDIWIGTSGPSATAIGHTLRADAEDAIVLGETARVNGENSMAIGLGEAAGTQPIVSGAHSFGVFMGDQSGVDLTAANTMSIMGGSLNVGTVTPTTGAPFKVSGTSSIMIPAGSDAQRPTGAAGMVRVNTTASPDAFEYYNAEGTAWVQLGAGGSSLWTDNTTRITRGSFNVINSGQTSNTAGLSDAGGVGNSTHAFYSTDKGALRGGRIDVDSDADSDTYDDAWDAANIGDYSFAWGKDVRASGGRSAAFGNYTIASGTNSIASGFKTVASGDNGIAFGWGAQATGAYSMAIGRANTASGMTSFAGGGRTGILDFPNTASGDGSFAFGFQNTAAATGSVALGTAVDVSSAADYSMALGLGANVLFPSHVTGTRSLGIFMGTGNITLAANNTMGVFGGKMVIDPATSSTQMTARGTIDAGAGTDAIVVPNGTTAQRPGTPATGMIRYNSTLAKYEAYEGTAWTNMIGAVNSVSGAAAPTSLVAGSNTQIQFNNNGVFGASANLVWNNASSRLGIGTTPTVALDVSGDIHYTGDIQDVSDRRLKTDIHPLSDRGSMMDRLAQIDTYSFRMKDDKDKDIEFGVMAQELEEIFPELVHTADDAMGTKSVNYIGIITPIIEASKELKAENDLLKAELASLRNDIDGLKLHTEYGFGKASFESLFMMMMAGFGMACLLFMVGGYVRKRHI